MRLRGNVKNILGKVVDTMGTDFGSRAAHMLTAIGPSLGPCCAQFINYKNEFPEKFKKFMVREGYLDLWGISRQQLSDSGILKSNIEVSGICSRCRTDLFFSYRGEGVTGRFATVAMIT